MNKQEIEKMIEMVSQGYSDGEIGKELKKNRKTIHLHRNKLGLKKKPGRGSWSIKAKKKNLEKILKADKPFYDFYWKMDKKSVSQGKRTFKETGEKFGVSRERASQRIKRYKKNLFGLSSFDGRIASNIEEIVKNA